MIRHLLARLTRGRFANGGEVQRAIRVYPIAGSPDWCDTCQHSTRQRVYAYVDDPTDPCLIGTYCPNCPPQEDQ